MLITFNPRQFESISESHVCEFHKAHPLEQYAGCTCSTSLTQHKRPDWNAAIERGLVEHREAWEILAQL